MRAKEIPFYICNIHKIIYKDKEVIIKHYDKTLINNLSQDINDNILDIDKMFNIAKELETELKRLDYFYKSYNIDYVCDIVSVEFINGLVVYFNNGILNNLYGPSAIYENQKSYYVNSDRIDAKDFYKRKDVITALRKNKLKTVLKKPL